MLGVSSLMLAALLSGCFGGKAPSTGPRAGQGGGKQTGYYKVGSPYQVDGVWYYPGVDYNYNETGIASWYGPDFHGKYTANGELYNMNDLTAAHPTLPLPSIVRVTNLENGRSILVRINDRGPYKRGRILDLSRRAAQLLGIIGSGTAKVRVQILPEESRQAALLAQQGEIPSVERITARVPTEKVTAEVLEPPPGIGSASKAPSLRSAPPVASAQRPTSTPNRISSPALNSVPLAPVTTAQAPPASDHQVSMTPVSPTSIYVQVGAFSQYDNADRLRARLTSIGHTKVTQVNVDGLPFFRVRMGPVTTVSDADQLLDRVVRAGYHDARIVVE